MRRLWAFLPALLALNASFLSVPASPEPLAPRLLPEVSVSSSAPLKALASPSEDPYFCSVDEIETGVLSEISALLGKKSSQSIEMLPVTNYAEYEAHLKAKDYDLLLDASDLFSSDYLTGYDLSDAYLNFSYSKAILRSGSTSLSTIACLGDNSMAGAYARSFYYPNQVRTFETMDECLSSVKNQECYAAIINSLYAQKLQNEDIRSIYSFTKLSEGTLKLKIAVKHSDDGAILKALNAAIAATSEDSFNAIVSRFSHFVKPTPSFFDQVYLNPVPYTIGFGSLLLVFIAVIFIILFAGRRKAMVLANREFERFIAYVCQTNEAVFEVNLQTRMINRYQLEKGEVKNVAQPFSPHSDFLDQVAPEDQAMVSQEMDENTLRALSNLAAKNLLKLVCAKRMEPISGPTLSFKA